MKSEEQILKLHLTIQLAARDFLFRAAAEDIHLVITQGLRTNAEQAKLYARGREHDANGKPIGHIVTDAPPGSSWHNFGLAFDVAVLADGKATWPNDPKVWLRIGEIGEAVGLEWGGRWKTFVDLPHFQWTAGLTLTQARAGRRPVNGPYYDPEPFPLKEQP
jgi:peptidoglycan L-alanyl-D-glutamate endopeptidase CwlK